MMLSFIGVYLAFLATLPNVLLAPAPYDLYDPDLFGPVPIDPMDESSTLAADTSSIEDSSMLDMPVDSDFLETSSAALDGLTFDSGDSSMFADPGSAYLSSSCTPAADATISIGTSKMRREDTKVCPNPGTTGNAPTGGQMDEPPIYIPSPDDLPSFDNPLVLPGKPPEDQTRCPIRFPARLCCDGPTGAVQQGYIYISVANCRPCK